METETASSKKRKQKQCEISRKLTLMQKSQISKYVKFEPFFFHLYKIQEIQQGKPRITRMSFKYLTI